MAKYDEKKQKREKEKQKRQKKADNIKSGASYWLLAPLIAVFSLIPLAMHGYYFTSQLSVFDWYVSSGEQYDLFLHCKMVLLIGASIYMVLALCYWHFTTKEKPEGIKMMIPLGLYALLSLLSALLSENSYFSFTGVESEFQPVWVLLGYCLTAYYAYIFLRTEEALRKVIPWFVAGIMIMLVIGVLQGIGYSPFRQPVVQKLLNIPENAVFNSAENDAYLTLFNTNYVGAYTVMTAPLLLTLFFWVKKYWQKAVLALMFIVNMFVLYRSRSNAGLLVFAVTMLFYLFFYRKNIIKNWKISLCVIAIVIVSFVGINIYYENQLLDEIKYSLNFTETAQPPLESIVTGKDSVLVTYNGQVTDFRLGMDSEGYTKVLATKEDGQEVESVFDENSRYFVSQDSTVPFQYAIVAQEDFKGFVININGIQWVFSDQMKEGDSTYYAYTNGKAIKLKKDAFPYNEWMLKHAYFASRRGFIWAGTLPLLKQYFWLGSGPDTFIIAFPNADLVAKNNNGYVNTYIDKPHCMYLQTAVQTGVPSLLCLLVFWGWYLIDSFRIYYKERFAAFLPKIGMGVLISNIGFLLTSLTNDSMIGVTPIFYLLLGMGMAVNCAVKKTR